MKNVLSKVWVGIKFVTYIVAAISTYVGGIWIFGKLWDWMFKND